MPAWCKRRVRQVDIPPQAQARWHSGPLQMIRGGPIFSVSRWWIGWLMKITCEIPTNSPVLGEFSGYAWHVSWTPGKNFPVLTEELDERGQKEYLDFESYQAGQAPQF